jgi:hypothetical protein
MLLAIVVILAMTTVHGLFFPKDCLCQRDCGDHGYQEVQAGLTSCRLCNASICLHMGRCCANASDIKNITVINYY